MTTVEEFLHDLVGSDDDRLAQAAAEAVLLLAGRRAQARFYFKAIQLFGSVSESRGAVWAKALADTTLDNVLAATNALPVAFSNSLERGLLVSSSTKEQASQEAAAAAVEPCHGCWCYLENPLSGNVLEVETSKQANSKVWLAKKDGSSAQLWQLTSTGYLLSKANSSTLTVNDDDVVVSDGADRVGQRWRFTQTDATGWSLLQSDMGNSVLDVKNADRHVRARVGMDEQNNTAAQLWSLVPAEAAEPLATRAQSWVIDPSEETLTFLTDLVRGEWGTLQDAIDEGSTERLMDLLKLLRLNVLAALPDNSNTVTAYSVPFGVVGDHDSDSSIGMDFDVLAPVNTRNSL